jgi:outer membrane lipoprotein-sorting protein
LIKVLLGLLTAGMLGAAEKPPYTADEVFAKMLEAQEAQGYYTAQVEKAEGPVGKKPVSISKGRLQAEPGAKARMEITSPSAGLVLSDGKHLWVELADVKQVMKYDATRLIASGNFFLDLASSVRHYSHAAYKRLIVAGKGFDPAQVTALELLPKEPDKAGFERMRVWVDHERWTVLRVLLDYGGTRSDVRFSKIKILGKDALAKDPSQAPEPGLFQYSPPKGYEVFDLDL